MNNDAPSGWPTFGQAERRVLEHQLKLHRWARADRDRRFADVFNLIYDRATLVVAWDRVSGNRGAQTAGVDAVTRFYVEGSIGVIPFLEDLRSSLKDGSFAPLPVKRAMIPKKGGKVRYLGIPTVTAECPAFWRVFGCGADCSSVPCAVRPSGAGVVRQTSWA